MTDRGQPVAELRPIAGKPGVDATLAELETRGVVVRPSRKRFAAFRPIENRGRQLPMAVSEDRDDRV